MTVTVCGVFQLAVVNVRLAAETIPSAVFAEETATATSYAGALARTTVNWALPPASVVVSPKAGVTMMPAVSSSMFVTETSAGLSPANFGSPVITGPTSIV